eukprot:Nk52_evm1s419 gene=Nk52_evmTU1s419
MGMPDSFAEDHSDESSKPGFDQKKRDATCKVCSDFKSWTKKNTKNKNKTTANNSNSNNNNSNNNNSNNTTTTNESESQPPTQKSATTTEHQGAPQPPQRREDCPVDSGQLGRATWTFLHTMAAYYPEKPSSQKEKEMRDLITGLASFYPCGWCAEHLQERLKTHPPDTSSRVKFARWMCETHNEVNERTGKEQFDCDRVDERWKDGWKDGSCDE